MRHKHTSDLALLDLPTLIPTYIGTNVISLDEYDIIPMYIGIIGGVYDY